MKTFDEIKEELKIACESKLERISEINVGTPEYINSIKSETNKILDNLDEMTEITINDRIKHIVDMAFSNKNIEDIIKFNSLGINENDIDIINHITECRYSKSTISKNNLIDAIENKINSTKIIENEPNKMRM